MENRVLPLPLIVDRDPSSFEVARVWVSDEGLFVSLKTSVWEDPAAWGIALADLVRHVANSYHQLQNFDKEKVVARIREGLEAELSSPGELSGQVQG